MKVGKAGKAAPHAAYIAREGKYADRLERGERLAATEAGNMPAWAKSEPGAFWLAADAHERANGTTYREMEIALPRELTTEQQTELVREWVKQEIGDRHAYQWAIHVPTAADGKEQPHVHLMFSERQVDGIERDPEQYFKRYNGKAPEKGGAKKGYGPNAGKTLTAAERAADLKDLRGRWEDACNRALERSGHAERIDMRSYAEQGRDVVPEAKQLPSQWRDPSQRANVIEFRWSKAEQAAAEREVRQAVPDVRAAVIDLVQARQRRDQVRTMAPADLVKAWDGEVRARATGYRQRADRLETRLQGQIGQIVDRRYRAEVKHDEQRPQEPQGLLAAFKRSAYEKAAAAWTATARQIKGWKQAREKDLRGRLKRIEGYLSRFHYGYADKATRKAEQHLSRERQEWAARVTQARQEIARAEVERKAQARAVAG
ncbi:hypothetical protein M2358_003463, partial [Kerstersia gyiorum]